MITTTSSSNGNMSKNLNIDMAAFKKSQFRFLYGFALRKSAGWIAIYSILLTLCYPLITWKENYELAHVYPNSYANHISYALNHHVVSVFLVSVLMCVMVLVFSAVLYSYMHGKRSADFFHSMPVERSTMLSANFAAGMTALTVPVWISSLIAMVSYPIFLSEIKWMALWKFMVLELLAWTMGAFILFAISTLVAVTVSTAVENAGYTVAMLLEGSILILIWDVACGMVFDTYVSIFGSSDITSIFENVLYYLSPVFALGKVIVLLQDNISLSGYFLRTIVTMGGWLPLIFWFLLGVGALWLARKLYTERQSERAEQWGRQSWLGFSVKLMSAIVGGFLFAVIFGDLLGLDNRFIFTFGALTGAPLTYLVIEAITNRGFHSMKKCLPYLALSTALILTASLYFAFDGFGFDEKIPEPEQIQTVLLELDSVLDTRVYSDEYAMKYEVLPNGKDTYEQIYNDKFISWYELEELESIELITEIHKESVYDNSNYMNNIQVSYRDGLYQLNRNLRTRVVSTENLLELLYCDEMLEKYNPFFELEADYLEFIQITDKMGNLIGEGEISEEHWAALLTAIRSDLKNTEAVNLLDSENNQDVVQLTFATKYPREIYQTYGALYHHSTTVTYVVREKDQATLELLESLRMELDVQDGFYDRLMGITLTQSYSKGLPGIARAYDPGVFEKYDYYVGEQELTDPEIMRTIVDHATSVENGRGDQYIADVFVSSEDGIHVNNNQFYVDRTVVAEMMVKQNTFVVPYILNYEEQALMNELPEVVIAENPDYNMNYVVDETKEIALAEEYIHWSQINDLDNAISLKSYCEQYYPQILEGKTSAELKCMEMTPFITEAGHRLNIGF